MALTPADATLVLRAVGLPALKAEHPVTRSVIGAIPPDKADYRPDPVTRSAIDLAWHIVSAEDRFLEAVAAGQFDLTPRDRPPDVRTPADVNRWYDERQARNVERLRALPGDALVKTIDFRGVFQFPAVVYVTIALNHTIHHRGQLSMYLRHMGARVPSIYGESYDVRQAREKGQD
jgi:uncharacterized damage-inducible protein DinB